MKPVSSYLVTSQWSICPWCGRTDHIEPLVNCKAAIGPDGYEVLIPIDKLEHGAYYHGASRGARVARWNAQEKYFVYLQERHGVVFSETMPYWKQPPLDEVMHTGFRPYGKVHFPPFPIPIVDADIYPLQEDNDA